MDTRTVHDGPIALLVRGKLDMGVFVAEPQQRKEDQEAADLRPFASDKERLHHAKIPEPLFRLQTGKGRAAGDGI